MNVNDLDSDRGLKISYKYLIISCKNILAQKKISMMYCYNLLQLYNLYNLIIII